MKIREWIKFWKFTKIEKTHNKEYTLIVDDIEAKELVIHSNTLHSSTYKIIRNLKTIQYNNAWLMRNKKGFNTSLFHSNYDVVVCDKFGNVIDMFVDLNPGHISNHYKSGHFIYFFGVGSIQFFNIKKESRMILQHKWAKFEIFADIVGI